MGFFCKKKISFKTFSFFNIFCNKLANLIFCKRLWLFLTNYTSNWAFTLIVQYFLYIFFLQLNPLCTAFCRPARCSGWRRRRRRHTLVAAASSSRSAWSASWRRTHATSPPPGPWPSYRRSRPWGRRWSGSGRSLARASWLPWAIQVTKLTDKLLNRFVDNKLIHNLKIRVFFGKISLKWIL